MPYALKAYLSIPDDQLMVMGIYLCSANTKRDPITKVYYLDDI